MDLVVYIAPWLSVPHFGDCDQNRVITDHSMGFSKIREMRQNKTDPSRASVGNEEELVSSRRSSSYA
ncbi:sorbin/SH3 domain protein [Perilla frutescens var. frutescens]|nr:sorbin/SH3 domain protein [Perilla frutescens var. frutescens]